jgi:hypothetical protein
VTNWPAVAAVARGPSTLNVAGSPSKPLISPDAPTFTTSWIATLFWLVLTDENLSHPNLLQKTVDLIGASSADEWIVNLVEAAVRILIFFLIWLIAIRIRIRINVVPSALLAAIHCALLLLIAAACCLVVVWVQ